MFCGECGTQNPDTNQFCKNCGKPLKRPQQAPAPQPAAVPVPAPAQTAYYTPPPAAVPQPAAPAVPAKPPLNKLMLVLGILGILAGAASWLRYPYLLGFLAMMLGIITLAKPENRRGAVLVIGCLAIIIGLASILFNIFYLDIFPPGEPDL